MTRLERSLGAAVTAALLWSPVAAAAQTSRVDVVAEAQAAKASRLSPEDSPAGEIVVKRVMSSPLLSGSGGVYPWFGSVYSGAGFGVGAGFLHRASRGSRINVTGAITFNGSQYVDVSYKLPSLSRAVHVQPWVDASWSRLKEIRTNGVGAGVPVGQQVSFDYEPAQARGGLSVEAADLLTLEASYGYLGFSTDYVSGDAGPLPGLGESLEFGVSQVGATLDWRASPGYSTHGGFLRGDWQRYVARDDDRFSYDQYEIETGHLMPLVREYFGIGLRALATTTRTDDGHEVPFVLLPHVGGGNTLRSHQTRRFRDRSRVVLTAEYLWRPSRFVDMAVFVDSGAVAPRLRDVSSGRFETGYGIGVRFHGPAFTALRLDVARGAEGWRFVFTGGQPF